MKFNVSIITINKNNYKGLSKTIDSVKNQKFNILNKEHIVIDGGSTDISKQIIKKNKKHLSYFQSIRDKGVYDAMNIGVKKAKFDWLIFLNSGDIFCNSYVLKNIKKNIKKNADIFYGNVFQVSNNKKKLLKAKNQKYLFKSLKSNQIFHQASLIKRNLNLKYLYDERLKIYSDYKFFYEMFKKKKIFTKINLNISNVEVGGISSTNKLLSVEEKKKFFRKKRISFFAKILIQLEYYKYLFLKKLNDFSKVFKY